MPETGIDLGASLYELRKAGRHHLPTVALQFAEANLAVASTEENMSQVFSRPPELGGPYGRTYYSWRSLRDELQTILADMATYLELVGQALCLAAEEYARADAEAAAEFNRLLRTNGDFEQINIPDPQHP